MASVRGLQLKLFHYCFIASFFKTRTGNRFFCSLFTIKQAIFSQADEETQGHAPINTRICISMKTTNHSLKEGGQITSHISRHELAIFCKVLSLFSTTGGFPPYCTATKGLSQLRALENWGLEAGQRGAGIKCRFRGLQSSNSFHLSTARYKKRPREEEKVILRKLLSRSFWNDET